MKRKMKIVAYLCMLCSATMAQNVTNVVAEQVGKKILITYDLDKTADVSICYSANGGKTFSFPIKQVSGDVGKNIAAGHRTATWDVLADVIINRKIDRLCPMLIHL